MGTLRVNLIGNVASLASTNKRDPPAARRVSLYKSDVLRLRLLDIVVRQLQAKYITRETLIPKVSHPRSLGYWDLTGRTIVVYLESNEWCNLLVE